MLEIISSIQDLIVDFRFDMMGKRIYKTYVNLSNIIVRISDGTPEGKEHAVLFNAHLDSTLPSPGAADDALSVGIMLDCMRVLIETPDWSPKHAIIFRKVYFFLVSRSFSPSFAVFNHAEECLQDGSHLFSTQHPIAPTWVSLDIFAFSILTPMSASELPSISKVGHIVRCRLTHIKILTAAGTSGREILFQATSEQMIEAYSHIPRYGLILDEYFVNI
jgi:Zn-dependent M28 family amino/carboxypeptidase